MERNKINVIAMQMKENWRRKIKLVQIVLFEFNSVFRNHIKILTEKTKILTIAKEPRRCNLRIDTKTSQEKII